MAEVKWIKIDTDIFNDEKIAIIESLPDADADSIIIIWFKLLCLAGRQNNSGVFILNEEMPFTEEMFSAIFRRPVASVHKALSTFQSLGMIKIIENVVTIPNWEKHQNIDGMDKIREQTRQRVQKHRDKQKALLESGSVTVALQERYGNAIEEEKDKDKDKEEEEDVGKLNNIIENQNNNITYYGVHHNIPLTDEELKEIQLKCPYWQYYLDRISEVSKNNGKKYPAVSTVLKWYEEDKAKGKWPVSSPASYDLSGYTQKSLMHKPVYKKKEKKNER